MGVRGWGGGGVGPASVLPYWHDAISMPSLSISSPGKPDVSIISRILRLDMGLSSFEGAPVLLGFKGKPTESHKLVGYPQQNDRPIDRSHREGHPLHGSARRQPRGQRLCQVLGEFVQPMRKLLGWNQGVIQLGTLRNRKTRSLAVELVPTLGVS